MDGARRLAQHLESGSDQWAEDRGEILLEAAHQWRLAGDEERADALVQKVVGIGGDDAAFARFTLAEACFDRGADDEARAHLATIQRVGLDGPGPAELVAELLEERGEYGPALDWADLALGLLAEDERSQLDRPGPPTLLAGMLRTRQRCRRALELPADDLDHAADVQEQNRLDFVDALSGRHDANGDHFRVLIWQRDQQRAVGARWPDVFTPDMLAPHAEIEARLRTTAENNPASPVTLVIADVDEFADYVDRTGSDPADEQTRLAYLTEAYGRGRTMSWPPQRNNPCWCGTGRKYKKCCGDPRQRN